MSDKRLIVKTVDSVGQPLELVVVSPGHKIAQEAEMAYNLKVSSLIRQGATGGERLLLRSEVEDYLLKAGIWTIADANKLQELSISIRASELAIQRGGISLADARTMAIEMSKKRDEIMSLVGKRQQLDSATVESVAGNYKFAILASKCIRYASDNSPYFTGYDDFMARGNEEGASKACGVFAEMIYGAARNIRENLFETRWLKKAGFINDDGRFVDRQGRLVDEYGKLVDESGRLVNNDGELIDRHGVRITETGDFYCDDVKPFTDEDGNPVEVCLNEDVMSKKPKEKKVSKKKTRKGKAGG